VADLNALLHHLVEQGGSDLHIKAGSRPHVRVDGKLQPTPFEALAPAEIEQLAMEVLPPARKAEFVETAEADFALGIAGMGRFRINVYRQRGTVGIALRRVVSAASTLDALGLPDTVEKLAAEPRGLVLVTGPTSSGKTTTVSGVINHINEQRVANIVTIEDPIEVLHADKRSIVSQREIGTDTASYSEAMRRVLRQDPDVVFIDELRDPETVQAALAAAEAERLVISTMRTNGATETINRIIEMYDPFQQKQARMQLASCLRGIVSQRLLERADGKGRIPAVEVLVMTGRIYEQITDPDIPGTSTLDRTIAEGEYYGMQTLDQALLQLAREGLVSLRDVMAVANDPTDLRIALQTSGVPV
jgi:twitching motility protein PilT